jgi:hypothetical protein
LQLAYITPKEDHRNTQRSSNFFPAIMKERELNHNNPELDSLRNLQKLQGKNSIGQEMQMKRKRKMMTEI